MSSSSINNTISDVAAAIKNTVTSEDVQIVVQRFFNDPSVQVIKYDLTPYSSQKLGYLATHRQLKITIKNDSNSSNTKELSMFVKSVPYENEAQAAIIAEGGLFMEEYSYFNEIEPTLLDDFKSKKWSPTCYLAKQNCLIMEDLRSLGYRLHSRFYNDLNLLKSALDAVARFHSTSIIVEARLSRNNKQTTTLKDVYPQSFKEKLCISGLNHSVNFVNLAIDIVRVLAKKSGLEVNYLSNLFDRLIKVVKPSAVHRNVVNHGDLWWNNMMFDDSLPLPNCRLVDYQIMRYAPAALDVLQLIYIHTSRNFREKHESELVEYYHTILTETVKSNDELAKLPSLEDTREAIESLRIWGPATASLYLPIHLINQDIVNEHNLDPENSRENYLSGDRTEFMLAYVQKDQVFRKRMMDIVNELVDINARL